MSVTINVEYHEDDKENVWKKEGGSDEVHRGHRLAITFTTDVSADCPRELEMRIQRAQMLVEKCVKRRLLSDTPAMKKFMLALPRYAGDAEKLNGLSEYVSKKFNEGDICEIEAGMMDEAIDDALSLLAAGQVTLPAGDALEKGGDE